ncbi:hypothetical protein CERZMDRAFT_41034 [Cercospora zeae-maydis SCOH1-5]|uniref:R3H domain-containing protein n=1 Tax=Cercospora zeae-maydis SCOH1-5 TaxID=717836 RepID=A0A6A6FH56_9PEZI|nr:hypothetical protein CERZMDRAFT_41034 [Cercospora zeae-maydis SCOH1-5]
MEAAAAAQPQQPAQRGRGPRRGRGSRRGVGQDPSLAFRPSSIAPAESSSQQPDATSQRGSRGGGRGRGRGRGGRGGVQGPEKRSTVNGRTFGGQLTRTETSHGDASNAASLQGAAPVFVPGQQHVQNVTQKQPIERPHRQPKQRRMSKSQAPDIATRTHEDIDNRHYECAICTSEVLRNSKVWSCHTCWTVFHLKCIKQWSSNAGASAAQQNSDGAPQMRQWRCPGCNLPKDDLPHSYTCWCEKETDPRPLQGIPPHSCGQTCGKERVRKCPHPCQLTCHAGPCPPCTHMGPTQQCYCGAHKSTKRCTETNYETGWSCGEICGSVLSCGEHKCERPCHAGSCGPCEVRLPARCYCGQMEKDVLCSDRGLPIQSSRKHILHTPSSVLESWTGVFDCGSTCERLHDCGHHRCEKQCHPQDEEAGHCPRSPDVVTHCSCGKTPLHELSDMPRTSCQDDVPSCSKPCDKELPCGHLCPQVCHVGSCGSCLKTVTINCRCERTSHSTVCHQGVDEPPQCMRVCRITLNCGRHMCDEHCCTGERKAHERQASRKKGRPLGSAPRTAEEGYEAEHICTRQCGRLLKCGNHVCEELCHKGPCGSCREAIFEEIACNCGRTVLQPPLPCGTQPPPCRYPCERPKACGHPQVAHNCHQDDDTCPKCPFLTPKMCMCGKKALKNQQCWLRDVSCGTMCGQKLKCGVHFCRKQCHRKGQCEDAGGQACTQPCGKEKKVCGHPDEAPCHAPFACKESKPCSNKIFITCECQAQKQEVKCSASSTSEGNTLKSLPCNEECARLERNRRLAVALNIDQSTHVEGGDHIPYSTDTLNLFAAHPKWCQIQEREFRVFATSPDEKRLRFKPMQAQQRSFIHSLAEDFGLDSESVDPEPHRHVMIWKTPRFVSAPNKTLADALRLRQQAQRSANASANASDNEGAPVKPKARSLDPFNSFRITNARFGLTIDEIRAEINAALHSAYPFTFDVEFLPSEDIVLKAVTRTLPPHDLERMLLSLKEPLGTKVANRGYGSMQLCTTDTSLNITRFESDGAPGDGWSRVAAKKSAPKVALASSTFGSTKNAFSALSGNKVTFAKKVPTRKAKAPAAVAPVVVDDWEAAEVEEEEKERSRDLAYASASDGEGLGAESSPGIMTPSPEVDGSGDEGSTAVESIANVEQIADQGAEIKDWADEVTTTTTTPTT